MSSQRSQNEAQVQAEAQFVNRRSEPRKRTFRIANIAVNGGRHHIPCAIIDISSSGARIQTMHCAALPEYFELLNVERNIDSWCEVKWRRDDQLGVRFLSGPPADILDMAPMQVNAAKVLAVQFSTQTDEPDES